MACSLPQRLRQLWLPTLIINALILSLLSPFRDYQGLNSSVTEFNEVIVSPDVIVVYSGPTLQVDQNMSKDNPSYAQSNNVKYHLNTVYFLKYGVQCKTQDTLIVLTNETLPIYQSQINDLDKQCNSRYKHRVLATVRNPSCYDLGSVYFAVSDGTVNITKYDYFVFINCGVTGPAKELAGIPWTKLFLDKLRGRVKMTGLTHNCFYPRPHIQSMMFALDQEGLQISIRGGAIFDCLQKWPDFNTLDSEYGKELIIANYEIEMSRLILSSGFALDPILRSQIIVQENISACVGDDLWLAEDLRKVYNGRIPFLNETVFFKSSRYVSPDLAKEIGFSLPTIHNWGK